MAEITIDRVVCLGKILLPKNKMTLDVYEENGLLCVKDDEIGLLSCAKSISRLQKEVNEDIVALWMEIAEMPDHILSPKSLKIKRGLLEKFKEG